MPTPSCRPRAATHNCCRSPLRGAPRQLLAPRLALAVDPRVAGPLAGCSRHGRKRGGPSLCEGVTDATDGSDRLGAKLLTQMVDVNFDGVALDFLTPAVDPLFEL